MERDRPTDRQKQRQRQTQTDRQRGGWEVAGGVTDRHVMY